MSWKQAFNSNLAAHLLINCKMSPGFHGKEEDVADVRLSAIMFTTVNIFHKLQMVSELADICRSYILGL